MRNAVLGLVVALALALIAADVSVFGIAFWKIALAAMGAVIFVLTGAKDKPTT